MKDTKYKILAYFDNQSYRKLFNEINSDYAENLQILLHNLSLFSYDVLIIGVILYKENISNIISAIRKITQIPIIILTDTSSLLCMSWKKELIYAGADCVMDINSTTEEVDLQIFSLARRNNKQKITQKQSETMIDKGKLVMDHKKHKVFWNDVALHLTRQEYNFLYLLAATPMRVYTFEQIYQLVWKDYSVGDIKNIIWCLVKRLRKKLNVVEDGAGNCIAKLLGHKGVRSVQYYRKMSNQRLADETREVRNLMSQIILANLDGWGEEYEQIRQDVGIE